MVRIRHADSVKIQVIGPKKIIPTPRVEIGRRSMTWNEFLVNVCNIQLDNDSFFVCNSAYYPNNAKKWTGKLNDNIKDFVKQYSSNMRTYTVRLHSGNTSGRKIKAPQQIQNQIQSQEGRIAPRAARKFPSMTPLTPTEFLKRTSKRIARNRKSTIKISRCSLCGCLPNKKRMFQQRKTNRKTFT